MTLSMSRSRTPELLILRMADNQETPGCQQFLGKHQHILAASVSIHEGEMTGVISHSMSDAPDSSVAEMYQ